MSQKLKQKDKKELVLSEQPEKSSCIEKTNHSAP